MWGSDGPRDLDIPIGARAIAIDTLKDYEEIEIELDTSYGFLWQAPYLSDWALFIEKKWRQ